MVATTAITIIMQLPEFTSWTPWPERAGIAKATRPGVYALARFVGEPPSTADLQAHEVIYFGETCNQALTGRWSQFHRSAFKRAHGHSGGLNFSAAFMEDRPGDAPPWLYVAACPVDLEPPHGSAYIRYLERWLIWEYVQKHGRLPVCNKK